MYNDKVGYGPTVSAALTELFGPGAGATATGPEPTDLPAGAPPAPPQGQQAPPPAAQPGKAPEVPTPIAVVPPGAPTQLSAAKAAALDEVTAALNAVQQAQKGGNFAESGQALQRLDDAMNKYRAAK